jgi:hypothetical protein
MSALHAEMFGSTAPSTSPAGLVIEQDRACPNCGAVEIVIGSSAGPHHARLYCRSCEHHCGWLPGQAYRFVSKILDHFGRPTEPIKIRHNEFVHEHEYSAAATATAISTERKKHMHIDQLYPSKFMRCADLNGRPMSAHDIQRSSEASKATCGSLIHVIRVAQTQATAPR